MLELVCIPQITLVSCSCSWNRKWPILFRNATDPCEVERRIPGKRRHGSHETRIGGMSVVDPGRSGSKGHAQSDRHHRTGRTFGFVQLWNSRKDQREAAQRHISGDSLSEVRGRQGETADLRRDDRVWRGGATAGCLRFVDQSRRGYRNQGNISLRQTIALLVALQRSDFVRWNSELNT